MLVAATTQSPRQPLAPSASYRPREVTQSLLYRVVQSHFKTFISAREAEGKYLPGYVTREFEAFIGCGVLANGFMRLKCDGCCHEKLVAFSCKKRGFCSSCGARRKLRLIQRIKS